jgi:hydroxypyruvate isomerase
MTKLAANLSFLFTEAEFLDRFAAAAEAGFAEVEFMVPYAWSAQEVAERARTAGVAISLFNVPAGNWEGGERGIAALPGRQAEFRGGLELALDYADALGCRSLHAMAGIVPEGGRDEAFAVFADNLRHAADRAAERGIQILIEPINDRVDIPGYLLTTSAAALAVIDAVAHPNLRLQADLYHLQVMEGDLARTLARAMPVIGRIQIADNPGRGEPGTGEINYPWLLQHIAELGYDEGIGCEYRPVAGTLAGLGWASPYLTSRRTA